MPAPLPLSSSYAAPLYEETSLVLTSRIGHTMLSMPSEWTIFGRVALSFAIGFAIGWEREVRGAAAGDRTFALVTTASCAVAAVWGRVAPQTVAGLMTGV